MWIPLPVGAWIAVWICAISVGAQVSSLPDYVLTYGAWPGSLPILALIESTAPYWYLYSGETNWPSVLSVFLQNVQAENDYTNITNQPYPLTPANLNDASIDASSTYLTSLDDPAANPQADWLVSLYGKPNSTGQSVAPVTIVLVNKTNVANQTPPGDLDAFYFAFYSFNLGPVVEILDEHFGNHVGDIEWQMIRFLKGEPQGVFYSQHSDGNAYTYSSTSKQGVRPISYIASGSHANYPTPGSHDYTDTGLIYDETDQGPAWDLTLNYQAYSYQPDPEVWTNLTANADPTGWLYFQGYFGDKQYPDSDPRQQDVLGMDKWGDGPDGPQNKTLVRTSMCINPSCPLYDSILVPGLPPELESPPKRSVLVADQ